MAKFTKKAIMDTFIELLGQKPFSQITVKEITEICEINHNTFYYYFEDIYAIIDEILETELKKVYEMAAVSESFAELSSYALQFTTEHRRAIFNLYHFVSRDRLQSYLMKVIDKVMDDFMEHCLKDTTIPAEERRFLVRYHKCAMLGLILTWLEEGKDEELQKTLLRFSSLTEESIAGYLQVTAHTLSAAESAAKRTE